MASLDEIAKQYNIKKEEPKDKPLPKKISNPNKRRTWLEEHVIDHVTLVDPDDICNWEYHDRPENELGDIKSLSDEFLKIGQQQPCIVRPSKIGETRYKYELIIGERRWHAARLAKIKLKVIIKEIDDNDAALAQAAENDNRKDLSDYAKGMSYSKLIDAGVIKQADLLEKLGRSKQYVSALLSYSKIPEEILLAIGDFTKVSSRTAETIKRLSLKGDNYIKAILKKVEQIKDGTIGHSKLTEFVQKQVSDKYESNKSNAKKIISANGRHLFTIRNDNNNLSSMHFPKDISALLQSKTIDPELLNKHIMEFLENELQNIK
ncbi:ParB/RepB/Spo0J family partition protein [Francisella sp. SYW-2]|uniref:ParB/RepB/Spo0J family partition protein n=1 Tax=Francisella sp. SYW-2 TaxID=2610886 RepID=UPI00123DBC6E|nr:ParB/RepB/Spo0J family partition protein [Francisella sp. SYW-2]